MSSKFIRWKGHPQVNELFTEYAICGFVFAFVALFGRQLRH